MELNSCRSSRAEKAQIWGERMKAWEQSGLSQVAFCEEHGLKHATFMYWRKRLSRPVTETRGLRLVPIGNEATIPTASAETSGITLEVNGVRIEVGADFDDVHLKRVIRVIQDV